MAAAVAALSPRAWLQAYALSPERRDSPAPIAERDSGLGGLIRAIFAQIETRQNQISFHRFVNAERGFRLTARLGSIPARIIHFGKRGERNRGLRDRPWQRGGTRLRLRLRIRGQQLSAEFDVIARVGARIGTRELLSAQPCIWMVICRKAFSS
jgi:hypothetical protein